MRREKKLFLLAMLTLLMSTKGYAVDTVEMIKNEIKTVESEKGIKESITKSGETGYKISANGSNNAGLINKITINFTGKTGINLIRPSNEKDKNAKTFFENDGKIVIKNGIGIQANENGTVYNNKLFENGKEIAGIIVEKGTGVQLNDKNAIFYNNGKIEVAKNGKGVTFSEKGTGGTFINNGNLVAQGTGVVFSKGGTGSTFINNGKIDVSKTGTGVVFSKEGAGGTFINNGDLVAQGTAIKNDGNGNTTVYLKKESTITGKILGSEKGVDILGFDKGNYSNLNVKNYDAIVVKNGNVKIDNSDISLGYNKGTNKYIEESKQEMTKGDATQSEKNTTKDLTISNSSITVDLSGKENKIIDASKLEFDGNISLKFTGVDKSEYDINKIFGIDNIESSGANFEKTVVWSYDNNSGKLVARKKNYNEIITKSQLKEFANAFQNTTTKNGKDGLYKKAGSALESLKTEEEFTKALTQLSGGIHGYTVDIAATNARTLSNTMKNRALTRDYLRNRPLNSWTQDIMYIDNNHRYGGLIDMKYTENGILGVSERQIFPNGRLGLIYGGTNGNATTEGYGKIDLDGAYFGGYYNHEFNDTWSLNSKAMFNYTHNRVTREISFGEGKNSVNKTFKSNYPTYTVGIGSALIYTVKDDLYNKAHFYTGIDINRIMQGTINESEDKPLNDAEELTIRKGAVNDKTYYSIVPSAGFMVQNTGYVFDKKYRIGADFNWETEVGNIKDGKRLNMKGISSEYKVQTTERENIFSYSLFGALDLTEALSVNARYTSSFSDEYNADMIGAGFEYKIDTMSDNLFGNIIYGLENNRPFSDRWGGTFGFVLETTDDSDRFYYSGNKELIGGDYTTSTMYKPKFTLSLNDKKSNWAYYFEGYYQNNEMFQGKKSNEAESSSSRLYGEVRWSDSYSKGKYGLNVGYRHEEANKPLNFGRKYYMRSKTEVEQLRITPNLTYELGNGFTFIGKTTGIFAYNSEGVRESQLDFLVETEAGISYSGFMPKWKMNLMYFRDDRWYDNSNRKLSWVNNKYEYDYNVSGRYQLAQLRPTIFYYFGNGSSFKFDIRIPLGNGQWYSDKKGNKTGAETYETRYGFTYSYPVTSGLTTNIGGSFLNIKSKSSTGDITKNYSFRPSIGFSYSF